MLEPKDEIKRRLNIAELIGEYVPLKPAGGSGKKGLCPFHGEKTPSFHVSEERQTWHCFGCNEGGDCFAFVMKMEGIDFPEALRLLAVRTGVEITRFTSEGSQEKQRLTALNELAAKFYRKVLTDTAPGERGRTYLASRDIPVALAEKFGLGFAPDGWDHLAQFFLRRGYGGTEGQKAGLLLPRKSGSGSIDRFRKRLMVPLRDHHGAVVGFTGRVIDSEDQPKYMNSPETPIYHKGSIMYGLDLAKTAIKKAGFVVIVEGNLDVIASHKAGVEQVVGSSGTALTKDQLSLLKRYTSTVVFSFDQDAAGFKAAQRGIREARALGFDIRAAILAPEAGKDPDDAVRKDPALWRATIEKTVPIMQYYIEQATRGKDLTKVDDKRAVGAFLLPELAAIEDVVEREHWLQQVADLLRIDMGVVREEMGRIRTIAKDTVAKEHAPWPQPVSQPVPAKLSKEEKALQTILGILLIETARAEEIFSGLDEAGIAGLTGFDLYTSLKSAYYSDRHPTQQSFVDRLRQTLSIQEHPKRLRSLDAHIMFGEQLREHADPSVSEQLAEALRLLSVSAVSRRMADLASELRRAEAAGDQAQVQRLMEEYQIHQSGQKRWPTL
ncbi:DNA primase [Candidatus Uhrbacteria bacterium]|nr:DNA primase [Candidatus Uhrbacteria bacterium]